MKERNNNIDIIKAFACIGVIFIHFPFQGNPGEYIKVLNRFSVPFFFFVSGFFLLDKNNNITLKRIKSKVIHILKLIYHSVIFHIIISINMQE